jgi:coniferyl-aldehyde dehydrogenase
MTLIDHPLHPVVPAWDDLRLRAVLAAQRQAQLQAGPPSAEEREDRIDRLMAVVLDNADELVDALRQDYGHRSRAQSYLSDVVGLLPGVKHTRKHLREWMRPEKVSAGAMGALGAKAWLQYQPLGVVGVIAPWNFPVGLALVPVAGAFAAGNRAMVKLSEYVPATSEVLARGIAREFDETELVAVTGGPETGAAFAALRFDHILLTGSPATGKLVQRAAADNLVPVTLELGGKCPAVISPHADVEAAAHRILAGKMMNVGQICLAVDYVFVPRQRVGDVLGELRRRFSSMYPTLLDNDDYSSVLGQRHYDRLQGYLQDAAAKGATLVELNPADEDFSGQPAHKLPLTLVLDPTPDMLVMQEEIFGPILPVVPYDDHAEVIQHVNAGEKPLAAYWFGPDDAERRAFLERTSSGGVTLNDVVLHFTIEDLPFGGVGSSGMGAYHGKAGFQTFSHARGVLEAPRRISAGTLMGAPYGSAKQRGLRAAIALDRRAVRRRLGRG